MQKHPPVYGRTKRLVFPLWRVACTWTSSCQLQYSENGPESIPCPRRPLPSYLSPPICRNVLLWEEFKCIFWCNRSPPRHPTLPEIDGCIVATKDACYQMSCWGSHYDIIIFTWLFLQLSSMFVSVS